MLASVLVVSLWDSVPSIKNSVHAVLNPTAGALLNWNLTIGMLVIVAVISLFTTLIQKYTTDQEALKKLKEGQKTLQEEMKKFQKENPAKVMELQKKQFESMPKMMKLSMASIVYTGIPFILFFRWFGDFFTLMGDPKFFGFLSWFWFYLIGLMIVGSVLRKVLKVH